MTNILVVTGSVRPNSTNEKVVPLVAEALEHKGVTVSVANLKELHLPFFDSPVPPSSPDFAPTDTNVVRWIEMVSRADGVVFVTPEYNHTMAPVQMNAIDWISQEWKDKPIALVGYGWTSGSAQAHDTAREALAVTLGAKVTDTNANLFFGKDLEADGTVADKLSVDKKINNTIHELLMTIEQIK